MKITVTYKETQSFGRYQNVSPSVTYETEISEETSEMEVTRDLMIAATAQVHGIIDDTLERNGHSPIYDADELYQAFTSEARGMTVIISALDDQRRWPPFDYMAVGKAMRLPSTMKLATRITKSKGYKFSGKVSGVDDLAPLPEDRVELAPLPEDKDEIPF